jgi:hypothetical protein
MGCTIPNIKIVFVGLTYQARQGILLCLDSFIEYYYSSLRDFYRLLGNNNNNNNNKK